MSEEQSSQETHEVENNRPGQAGVPEGEIIPGETGRDRTDNEKLDDQLHGQINNDNITDSEKTYTPPSSFEEARRAFLFVSRPPAWACAVDPRRIA